MAESDSICAELQRLMNASTQALKDYNHQLEFNRNEKTGFRKKDREAVAKKLEKVYNQARRNETVHVQTCEVCRSKGTPDKSETRSEK